jgi:hypothetical protein
MTFARIEDPKDSYLMHGSEKTDLPRGLLIANAGRRGCSVPLVEFHFQTMEDLTAALPEIILEFPKVAILDYRQL